MRGGGGVSGGPAPWDRIDQQAAAGAHEVLGEPRPGFGAVGEGGAGGGAAGGRGGGSVQPAGGDESAAAASVITATGGAATASSPGAVEVCAVGGEAAEGVGGVDRGQARGRANIGPAGRGDRTSEAAPTAHVTGEPGPAGASAGTVSAITATTGYGENAALPTEPPGEEEGWDELVHGG